MKLNTGKIIKIIALILGVIGLVISLMIMYIYTTAHYSTSLNARSSYVSMQTILPISIYFFCIISVCSILYGIGHIIVILQKMSQNMLTLSKFKNATNIQQPGEILQKMNSINPEITHIQDDNMWKRPVSDNKS